MPHWPWLCITPSVPFVPSSGLSNFTLSTSEELNKTAVKPIRHEWRWQVKSFFFFFYSSFLLSLFRTPTLALFSKFDVILSEQRKCRREWALLSGRLQSSWLMLLPRGRMTMKGPSTPATLPTAFTFLISNISHAALSFTIYLRLSHIQSKALHREKKTPLYFFCVVSRSSSL